MTAKKYAEELQIVAAEGQRIISLEALQGTWTTEQYLKLTNYTRRLIEFADGYIEILPYPTDRHQGILAALFVVLYRYIQQRGGTAIFAALRMQVNQNKFREPDILLLLDERDSRAQDDFWLGADLVAEVVNPEDLERDTVIKRLDYAEAGIPEYWIVNPEDETITVLQLEGNQYTEYGVFRRGDKIDSVLLPEFTVDAAAVFDVG